ncbi:formate dehydrogenase subunit delta [Enterovirga aerilata]|uniref:Formate dehydrogenase subunit delta n=1 Tax=Enterovirga aerilata TaxID=2730920 RepID=A0A849I444_9HYPH|nr:formate dehydrogenase subunit delta [Enterovirga sp. DB1703]NNM72434.1 formate dehydrogenase subunit delta [Enterovirga sp. DB1703]
MDHAPTDPATKLVRMANQIASFFRSYPDEEAAAGVHDHIVAFWSPVMRRDLLAYVDADGSGLDPLVERAMHRIGKGPSPTAREAAGPDEVGQLGAGDAG